MSIGETMVMAGVFLLLANDAEREGLPVLPVFQRVIACLMVVIAMFRILAE